MQKYRVGMIVLLALLFIVSSTNAKEIQGAKVIKIIDGDSIVVSAGTQNIEIRLWGIDTPEYRQPFSKAAKKVTKRLLQDQTVDLLVKDIDKYGRVVAMVTMGNGQNVNGLLVKRGYAWVHIYYCKEPVCDKWRDYQKAARKKKLGFWREPAPVAPWIWKKKHKRHW